MNLFLIILYLFVCRNLFLDISQAGAVDTWDVSYFPYIGYVRKLLLKVVTSINIKEPPADLQSSNWNTESPRQVWRTVTSPPPFSDPPLCPVCAHPLLSSSLSLD